MTPSISTEAASISKTMTGWTVGGGFEYAFSRNWTLNAEYLFADFGNIGTTRARVQSNIVGPLNTVFDHNVDLTTNIVRAGINYKF